MTVRDVYDYTLVEINKVEAPTLLLEDFNYFLWKAITSVVNKRYALYNIDQQIDDDLRVIGKTVVITNWTAKLNDKLQGATYTGVLPKDYLHIAGVVVEYEVLKPARCEKEGDSVFQGASRLKPGMWPRIIQNYYMRPTWDNPYFYIHDDADIQVPVNNPATEADNTKAPGTTDANPTPVTIQIRYGTDNTRYRLIRGHIEYLKAPRYVELTAAQRDSVADTSQIMEWPDYMCFEIIKELVALTMENSSDQRLNTNIGINQTPGVTRPAGPQAQQ